MRTNFAAHMYSYPFAKLARHPRMVEPIRQIFGEAVYMHQFKINGKMAFDGDVWQWHQDYGTWINDDQMPEARAMNVAIFLDEVNEFNGPLMFIPGSHKQGVLDAQHDTSTTSYPLWTIDHEVIRKLVERGGIVAPKGPPGSMILFHGCLVHASTSNLSPWNRVACICRCVPSPTTSAASNGPATSPTGTLRRSKPCRTIACSSTTRSRCPGRTARLRRSCTES